MPRRRLRRSHGAFLQLKQRFLHVQPAGVPHQLPASADDPMAGNGNQNGIMAVGHPHSPAGFGISNGGGHLPIRASLPIGDIAQHPPHPLLKFGSPENVRKIKRPPLACQVLIDLPEHQVRQRRPSLVTGGLTCPHQKGDRVVLVPDFKLVKQERINCAVTPIHVLPLVLVRRLPAGLSHPFSETVFIGGGCRISEGVCRPARQKVSGIPDICQDF